MSEIFLYTSMILVLGGYVLYFLLIFIGRMKDVGKCTGFDVTKDIISEYDSINVIENRGYFTIYNIKRRVIKIASNNYYGRDLSSISISLMEAGISIVDNNKNKYINLFRVVFSNLKILYVLPLIGLFISNSSFNVSDAKIGFVFMLVFAFISYIFLEVKGLAYEFVDKNIYKIRDIKKNDRLKIVNFMNRLLLCDKIIYFGELLMVVRMVFLMFDI